MVVQWKLSETPFVIPYCMSKICNTIIIVPWCITKTRQCYKAKVHKPKNGITNVKKKVLPLPTYQKYGNTKVHVHKKTRQYHGGISKPSMWYFCLFSISFDEVCKDAALVWPMTGQKCHAHGVPVFCLLLVLSYLSAQLCAGITSRQV